MTGCEPSVKKTCRGHVFSERAEGSQPTASGRKKREEISRKMNSRHPLQSGKPNAEDRGCSWEIIRSGHIFWRCGSSPFCCIFVHIQRNPLLPLLHIRIIKKDKLSLFTKTFLLYCAVSKLIKHVFFVMIRMYKQAGMVCLVILFRSEKFE